MQNGGTPILMKLRLILLKGKKGYFNIHSTMPGAKQLQQMKSFCQTQMQVLANIARGEAKISEEQAPANIHGFSIEKIKEARRGIAAYELEQKILLRMLRKHTILTNRQFDRIFCTKYLI